MPFVGQYVVFKIENEDLALDVSKVKEIINPIEIARVPNVPDFVEGLINMRGSVHAVVNLRKRFHVEGKKFDDHTKIILINRQEQLVGIVVDAVTEIIKVEEGEIDKVPDVISKVDAEMIQGVIKKGKRMVILLDIDRIIDSAA